MIDVKKNMLIDIAHHYGTPVYVYDLDILKKQFNRLESAFARLNTDIHFAVKANNNPVVLKTIHEAGGKFDTVSLEEIRHLLDLGIPEEDILFTPSCPSEEELQAALRTQVNVHISEIEHLEWVAGNFPGRPVGIRINPGLDIGGNKKIATAHAFSKFGIPWDFKDNILHLIKEKDLKINGLHVHLGSEVQMEKAFQRNVDFLMSIRSFFPDLKYLDFGGGFKVPFRPGDQETDINALARYIEAKLTGSTKSLGIKIEPGKFLIAQAGVLLTRVNLVKTTPYKKFVCVNSGFNHFIRPMYYGAYHPVVNLTSKSEELEKYDIVGYLCEEDTFAYDRELPLTGKNDILAILFAGAYGEVMASRYNLRPFPKEIVIDGDRIIEV